MISFLHGGAGRAVQLMHMKKTILFADNERSIRQYCQCELAALGFNVLGAESGETASRMVDAFKVDLVILDQHMPGSSGTQSAQNIKQKHPNIPVILFTSDKNYENYSSKLVDASVMKSADLRPLKSAIAGLLFNPQVALVGQ